jgi:hypothetical protein
VCERWRESFEAFLADMGHPPKLSHSLDRYPDNNGNYEPGNCRWATDAEQVRNRRNTIFVEYRGRSVSLAEAIELAGAIVPFATVWARIKQLHWDTSRAVETPPLKRSQWK